MTSQQLDTCWLQWEQKWKTAEHHCSDELKRYSSSISLQKESACIQHPPHTVLVNAWEAISFLRANTQLWTVKMLISVTLSFFFSICFVSNKCNTLQEHFAVDNNAAIMYLVDTLTEISSWESSNMKAVLMFLFLLVFLLPLGEESGLWRGVGSINFHLLNCLEIIWTTHTAEQADVRASEVINTNKKAVVTQIRHYVLAKNCWYIIFMQIESISITSDPACKHQIPGILLETIHY